MSDAAPEKSKGKALGKGCLIVIGVIVALVVIGAIMGGETDQKAETVASSKQTEAVDVTAKELSQAFQENEAKAKLAYDERILRVTGKVKDIDLDFADKPVIKLTGAGDVQGMGVSSNGKMTDVAINGISNEAAANVAKGSNMSFLCTGGIDEVMGGPQLADCSVDAAK